MSTRRLSSKVTAHPPVPQTGICVRLGRGFTQKSGDKPSESCHFNRFSNLREGRLSSNKERMEWSGESGTS